MGWAIAVWITAASVHGQLLMDDFESNTLLASDVPAGNWDARVILTPANTLATSSAAAHRGMYGLSFVDVTDGPAGQGSDNFMVDGLPTLTGPFHLRTWLRMQPATGAGAIFPIQIGCNNCAASVADLIYDNGSNQFGLQVWTTTTSSQTLFSATAHKNKWVLVELWLYDVGGVNSGGRLYFDGVEVARIDSINQTGLTATAVDVGSSWQVRPIRATIHFDDVRFGAAPGPSTLVLDAGAGPGAFVGDCLPISLSAVTSATRAVAAPPFVMSVALASTNGSVTQAADCSGLSSVDLGPGQSSKLIYFRAATAGPATITASFTDLLPASVSVLAIARPDAGPADAGPPDAGPFDAGPSDAGVPDAGPGDGGSASDGGLGRDGGLESPGAYAVGCGCSAAGQGPLACVMMMLLLGLRGRPRTNKQR